MQKARRQHSIGEYCWRRARIIKWDYPYLEQADHTLVQNGSRFRWVQYKFLTTISSHQKVLLHLMAA